MSFMSYVMSYSRSVLCLLWSCLFFFFKQKTAYEMRISDWSSDVCSSDLPAAPLTARGNRRSILAMTLTITPSGQACGARVTGVDLTRPLDVETVANIRTVWLDHHVLAFPDQKMSETDLERFTGYFGGFGADH